MTGEELKAARAKLGEIWRVGRDLSPIELARAVGLSAKNGNDTILRMESGQTKVSGPVGILVTLYLGGALPPDELEIFKLRGRKRAVG